MSSKQTQATIKVVEDCHQLLLWLIPKLDKFPRSRRFTLGERLETALLDVTEMLVDAAYRQDKYQVLHSANRRLARLRHLWRIAYELKVISLKEYEYASHSIEIIGRQLGGWLKSL